MKNTTIRGRLAQLAAVGMVATVAAVSPSSPAAGEGPPPQAHGERPVCGPPAAGTARCHAHVVTRGDGATPAATTTYASGYTPLQLRTAYRLPGVPAGATPPTVAIVDAYDNPNAEADLATYRSEFLLPPCTTANGCFRKVNQAGAAEPYPAPNVGWGQEIALDLDMVSAICPACRILLVEAKSNTFADLGAAVYTAAGVAGVVAISNSYGASEFSTEASYEAPYNQQGIAVTVSSGDAGYGVEFPAASRYVTAVGGTKLTLKADSTRATETVWSGAGSGCSAYITTKPAGQPNLGCSRRTVADVAAVADPATGVAVYDSYGSTGGANWYVFGGTSVAAPIIAGVYALAGATTTITTTTTAYKNATPYSAPAGSLYDVTSGSNGRCTTPKSTANAYLCTGVRGYDGPTGLGTPIGVGAFSPRLL